MTDASTLIDRLEQVGVSRIAIIDDAYDVPLLQDIRDDWPIFANVVERDSSLRAQLAEIGIGLKDPSDLQQSDVEVLWARRRVDDELTAKSMQTLFATKKQDWDDAESIADGLCELGLKVIRLGSDADETWEPVDLVLLDYYLGSTGDPDARDRSMGIAKELYKRIPADSFPFFVVMSSVTSVRDEVSAFRAGSGLVSGMFDFASKEDLKNPVLRDFRLASWMKGMPARRVLQSFVGCLEKGICDGVEHFMDRVKSVTIEDYVYMQTMNLTHDGLPLGSYLMELYAPLLTASVLSGNQELLSRKKKVDELDIDGFVPRQYPPSENLGEVFGLSYAEPISEELGQHPRRVLMKRGPNLPYLRFGDMFIKDATSPVYMVATPDCDLAYVPGTNRTLDRNQSVILIPGQLRNLHDSTGRTGVYTDLLLYEGEQYRVFWNMKEIKSMKVKDFFRWQSRWGYSRPKRIRLPHALRVQKELVSDLSRIGMPAPPPLYELIDLDVYGPAVGTGYAQCGHSLKHAATVVHKSDLRKDPVVVINSACISELTEIMSLLVENMKDKMSTVRTQANQRLEERINKLRNFQNTPEELYRIVGSEWPCPDAGKHKDLVRGIIGLHRDGLLDQGCSNHIVCLNFYI